MFSGLSEDEVKSNLYYKELMLRDPKACILKLEDEYSSILYDYLNHRTKSVHLANCIFINVLVRAYQHIRDYLPTERLLFWLFRFVVGECERCGLPEPSPEEFKKWLDFDYKRDKV